MPVCLIVTIPGGTQEQYDRVAEGLGEQFLGGGQLSHTAGPTADGWCVVDVWESREHFDRFIGGRLGEQLQSAGVPEPQIVEFPVYRWELAER